MLRITEKLYSEIEEVFQENSPNAINNWTDRQTKSASSAVLRNMWNVCLSIKIDSLIAAVIASHVAFATVDAKILLGLGMLLIDYDFKSGSHLHHRLRLQLVSCCPIGCISLFEEGLSQGRL